MISNHFVLSQVDNSKNPFGVFTKRVGKNSIYCNYCKHWVDQHCTNL